MSYPTRDSLSIDSDAMPTCPVTKCPHPCLNPHNLRDGLVLLQNRNHLHFLDVAKVGISLDNVLSSSVATTAILSGLNDSLWSTQISALIGKAYPTNSDPNITAAAFALFKCIQQYIYSALEIISSSKPPMW
ncbi:hypothetical protein ACTXT7_001491 [Hymenolepis weldensis]